MTNEDQGVAGVGLIVAAYVDENRADAALDSLKQARDAQQFYFDDAVDRPASSSVRVPERRSAASLPTPTAASTTTRSSNSAQPCPRAARPS